MSIVRNSAQKLSDFVVKHASPGSKEWAEAMASEAGAIENDWHALGWAAGGLRVLFYPQPKPLGTLQDLNDAAQSYADRRRLQVNNIWLARNLSLLTTLLLALTTLPKVFYGSHRPGSALLAVGWLNLAFISYLLSREPNVPNRDDASGLIRFYREELARTTKIFYVTFWLPVCFILIALGYELTMTSSWARPLGLLWLGFLPLLFSKQRSDRRRLVQIDALLATQGER